MSDMRQELNRPIIEEERKESVAEYVARGGKITVLESVGDVHKTTSKVWRKLKCDKQILTIEK